MSAPVARMLAEFNARRFSAFAQFLLATERRVCTDPAVFIRRMVRQSRRWRRPRRRR